MNKKIILISGKQGSGKTTLSNKLDYHFGAFAIQVKFAETLYKIWHATRGILREAGVQNVPDKDGGFLQWLGTEYGRKNYGDSIWVDITRRQADNAATDVVLIDDCRFQNEFAAFPDALRVRLKASEDDRSGRTDAWRDNTTHASETDLDGLENEFDLVLNTGKDGLNAEQVYEAVIAAFNAKFS